MLSLTDNPALPDEMVDGSQFFQFENLSISSGSAIDLFFSGANSFTSFEIINSSLMLGHNSTLVADVFVGNNGFLNIEGDGFPGFSVGTVNVDGTVTFASGSNFDVNISINGASDLLNVTGSVLIETGSTVNVSTLQDNPKFAGIKEYTLLTATNGISGTFTTITTPSNVIFPLLIHGANDVLLRVGKLGSIFSPSALTGNQTAIAGLCDGLDPSPCVSVEPITTIFLPFC